MIGWHLTRPFDLKIVGLISHCEQIQPKSAVIQEALALLIMPVFILPISMIIPVAIPSF